MSVGPPTTLQNSPGPAIYSPSPPPDTHDASTNLDINSPRILNIDTLDDTHTTAVTKMTAERTTTRKKIEDRA
jgi:hypothetical protein